MKRKQKGLGLSHHHISSEGCKLQLTNWGGIPSQKEVKCLWHVMKLCLGRLCGEQGVERPKLQLVSLAVCLFYIETLLIICKTSVLVM
uniref:Uncharacterized protein n=1 Tax=Setaria viridis TaxID=4556 RepID=A0A4U6SUH5_SETVI|nr:hypothetical protein SEVIR_9G055250v2 [Setaria viridis]